MTGDCSVFKFLQRGVAGPLYTNRQMGENSIVILHKISLQRGVPSLPVFIHFFCPTIARCIRVSLAREA